MQIKIIVALKALQPGVKVKCEFNHSIFDIETNSMVYVRIELQRMNN